MCTSRCSHMPRPVTWMVTVLALFVFALAPVSHGAVYLTDGTGGTEGDPTDGHDSHRGGGTSGLGVEVTKSIPETQRNEFDQYLFVPLVVVDGSRIQIRFVWLYPPIQNVPTPGGMK